MTDEQIKDTAPLVIAVIDEMGGTAEMARKCDVSMAVVSTWKRKGFPRFLELYLRKAYPKLKAWKERA